VLAAGEALLLRSRHDDAIDDDRRSRIVEHGIDPKDSHNG
jgi:hypothetical protein